MPGPSVKDAPLPLYKNVLTMYPLLDPEKQLTHATILRLMCYRKVTGKRRFHDIWYDAGSKGHCEAVESGPLATRAAARNPNI
jgi:hypothetical protein